jgi:hypothetical protein
MGPHDTASAWAEKVQWCHAHIGRSVKVTVTGDKSLVYGKVLIDDTSTYVLDWLRHHSHGRGIVPAQPYNEGFEHSKVVRCDGTNLDEVRAWMRSVMQ